MKTKYPVYFKAPFVYCYEGQEEVFRNRGWEVRDIYVCFSPAFSDIGTKQDVPVGFKGVGWVEAPEALEVL